MPIDLGHSQTVFTQTFLLDVNKILLKINNNIIKILMQEEKENQNQNNNKTQIDVKSKISDIFGKSQKKNINNINKTDFGNKNEINNKNDNNSIKNKIFGNIEPNYKKPLSNKKDAPTPNSNLSNSNSNLSKSNSSNSSLPGENDIYTATKDEQAAPGLNNNNKNT